MTDAEKATFLRACELAEKIGAETKLFAEVDYMPDFSWKVSAHWFEHNGNECVGHGHTDGFNNIIPYLETIYQFAPRKAAGA